MRADRLEVQVDISASLEDVWTFWTNAQDICRWNNASDDWETTKATNDLRVGGTFSYYMKAKDKSTGFDFNGTYTAVTAHRLIEYTIEGGRKVSVSFESIGDQTRVSESFEPETENSHELQRSGWQAILDNFKVYVEQTKHKE